MNMQDAQFTEQLDKIVKDYLQLQLNCMMLQHEGCNRIRNNDSENGLIILEAVRRMREALFKQKQELMGAISEVEFTQSQERLAFHKALFNALSDTALKDNSIYFEFPQRPADPAYKCDEITCKAKTYALAKDYFPDLYKSVA